MEIAVLVSTIDSGIDRVPLVLLEQQPGIRYFVVHQVRDKAYCRTPSELLRPDTVVHQVPGSGLARSRNVGISIASGDIGLIADDDVRYRREYFDQIRAVFEKHVDLDVALFKIKTGTGEPEYKEYPDNEMIISSRYSASSVEMAFRIDSVRRSGIRFDERFGIGSPHLSGGEESIFLHDCLRAGLKIMYFPCYVVEHPYESSLKGIPLFDRRRNWMAGAYDARVGGSRAILKAVGGTLKSWGKIKRHGESPLRYFKERLSGALYILVTDNLRSGE